MVGAADVGLYVIGECVVGACDVGVSVVGPCVGARDVGAGVGLLDVGASVVGECVDGDLVEGESVVGARLVGWPASAAVVGAIVTLRSQGKEKDVSARCVAMGQLTAENAHKDR